MASKIGIVRRPLVALILLGLKRPVEVEFDNGFKIRLNRGELPLLRALVELSYPHGVTFYNSTIRLNSAPRSTDSWVINSDSGTVELPSGVILALDSLREVGIVAETFVYDIHFRGADLRGCSVVDVGASFGDTALYFASRGAQVYAFEPEPSTFKQLIRNVSLNPALKDRIVAVDSAVGPDGEVSFNAGQGSISSFYGTGGRNITVRSLSLSSLLAKYRISDPLLLKVDAKGAEFDIIDQPEISKFRAVSVEYSSGMRPGMTPERLVSGLERMGFRVTRRFKHNDSFFRLESHGIIHAVRDDVRMPT